MRNVELEITSTQLRSGVMLSLHVNGNRGRASPQSCRRWQAGKEVGEEGGLIVPVQCSAVQCRDRRWSVNPARTVGEEA